LEPFAAAALDAPAVGAAALPHALALRAVVASAPEAGPRDASASEAGPRDAAPARLLAALRAAPALELLAPAPGGENGSKDAAVGEGENGSKDAAVGEGENGSKGERVFGAIGEGERGDVLQAPRPPLLFRSAATPAVVASISALRPPHTAPLSDSL
jgi:hypothetical protein